MQVQGPFAFPVRAADGGGGGTTTDELHVAEQQREAALRALAVRNSPRWLFVAPGASPESEDELKLLLRADFERHHIYWNSIRWHKYVPFPPHSPLPQRSHPLRKGDIFYSHCISLA